MGLSGRLRTISAILDIVKYCLEIKWRWGEGNYADAAEAAALIISGVITYLFGGLVKPIASLARDKEDVDEFIETWIEELSIVDFDNLSFIDKIPDLLT